MGLIQRIKCHLGIHEFEDLEFMVNKGQWNNVWTAKATYRQFVNPAILNPGTCNMQRQRKIRGVGNGVEYPSWYCLKKEAEQYKPQMLDEEIEETLDLRPERSVTT